MDFEFWQPNKLQYAVEGGLMLCRADDEVTELREGLYRSQASLNLRRKPMTEDRAAVEDELSNDWRFCTGSILAERASQGLALQAGTLREVAEG